MLFLPKEVETVITTLQGAGYSPYLVGGCVREMLRGKAPSDYDMTSDAPPQEVLRLFGEWAHPTGLQHGTVTVFDHSVAVALMCLQLAALLRLRTDTRSLVRGALLHDYFLYDWHIKEKGRPLHGTHHARRAMKNAERDFGLNKIERNMILAHMFPLNLTLPRYRESVLLCTADKLCALRETARGVLHR